MAPLKSVLVAAFALASTASAIPLAVERRDAAPNVVTETVWVTMDTTTTPPPPAAPTDAPAAFAAEAQPAQPRQVSGGPCQGQGNACTGDVTHYDGGLGACGWNVNTASDMQIALPYGLMGTLSNSNPYCGKSLSIKATDGSIVQATVGDKCMGCEGDSIDLTDALFKAVAPNGDGRVHGVQWWFN